MPTYVRTTKKLMCDPMLRCRPPTFDDDKGEVFTNRRAYEKSSIELPAPWSWKMLQGMASSLSTTVQKSKFDLADSRDRIPYFPFCEELYKFATGKSECNWEHCISEDSKSSTNTYIFPCGCTDPDIQFISYAKIPIKSSSAFMCDPTGTRFTEIPCCPVFAQGAVVKKRKRKKAGLSLTDNRTYSRKVRERSKKTAKTAKGCSKQLMEEDVPTDSD